MFMIQHSLNFITHSYKRQENIELFLKLFFQEYSINFVHLLALASYQTHTGPKKFMKS